MSSRQARRPKRELPETSQKYNFRLHFFPFPGIKQLREIAKAKMIFRRGQDLNLRGRNHMISTISEDNSSHTHYFFDVSDSLSIGE
jgi:hypothetical protein